MSFGRLVVFSRNANSLDIFWVTGLTTTLRFVARSKLWRRNTNSRSVLEVNIGIICGFLLYMPALFRHVAKSFRNVSTRVDSLPRKINVHTTYGDGASFRRTEAIETEKSEHRVGDSMASSLATISTTKADGTLPVQLSVIDTAELVDWAGNLVAK